MVACLRIRHKLLYGRSYWPIMLEMSYDGRRVLRACKSKYRYTELFGLYRADLQAEEQMLDWVCLTALWGTLHTIYNGNSLGGSRRPRELLPWIPNTVDSLTSVSWADLRIARHPVRTRRLGLLANHRIQHHLVLVTLCYGFGPGSLAAAPAVS